LHSTDDTHETFDEVDDRHVVDLGIRPGGRTAELIECMTELSRSREASDVQNVVKRAARQLARADGAAFILRDGEECFYVDEDAIGPLWKGRRFPMDDCVSGWAMRHREMVAIPDVFADARVPVDAYRPTFVRSMLMTPIGLQDPVGAIGVYWSRPYTPTAPQRALLQALADATAVALASTAAWDDLRDRLAASVAEVSALKAELRRAADLSGAGTARAC
jgi:GAF domain-containing protein